METVFKKSDKSSQFDTQIETESPFRNGWNIFFSLTPERRVILKNHTMGCLSNNGHWIIHKCRL